MKDALLAQADQKAARHKAELADLAQAHMALKEKLAVAEAQLLADFDKRKAGALVGSAAGSSVDESGGRGDDPRLPVLLAKVQILEEMEGKWQRRLEKHEKEAALRLERTKLRAQKEQVEALMVQKRLLMNDKSLAMSELRMHAEAAVERLRLEVVDANHAAREEARRAAESAEDLKRARRAAEEKRFKETEEKRERSEFEASEVVAVVRELRLLMQRQQRESAVEIKALQEAVRTAEAQAARAEDDARIARNETRLRAREAKLRQDAALRQMKVLANQSARRVKSRERKVRQELAREEKLAAADGMGGEDDDEPRDNAVEDILLSGIETRVKRIAAAAAEKAMLEVTGKIGSVSSALTATAKDKNLALANPGDSTTTGLKSVAPVPIGAVRSLSTFVDDAELPPSMTREKFKNKF